MKKSRLLMILLLLVPLGISFLFISSPVFAGANQLGDCGGDEQRACCAGTFEVLLGDACDSGNTEVPGCSADCLCGGFNPFRINASGTCKARESCGGENERACCDGLSEGKACETGLIKIEGCAGNCLCGGRGTGQVSVHTCVKPTECGGEGQRACCAAPLEPRRTEINGPCEAGLVEIPGCTGDCSCGDELLTVGKSSSTCVASNWTEQDIDEPGTQWTSPTVPRECPLRGYADMHIHLNAHLAHGGKVFAGQPAPVGADGMFTLEPGLSINTALSAADDKALHGDSHALLGGDTIGGGTKDGSSGNGGAPAFNNWPTWTTTTHQQTYYTWLERAYRGGLRLAVMFAVTNEALCKSTKGTDCANSMGPIDEQLDAAYDFQEFIDGLHGGPGQGWFRIVTEPSETRQVIADGKLAVVLGIEVDNLFNCKEQNDNRPDASCPNMKDADGNLLTNDAGEPIDTIEKAVDYYYDKGVRHVFPIHNFDNAFGAAATWQDVIGVGGAFSEQRWWEVEDCGTGKGDYGFWLDNALAPLIALFGFDGEVPPIAGYKSGVPSCNKYGLNLSPESAGPDKRGLGAKLINALMAKGMLIDIDHMSNKSLDETLELTKQTDPQYPLVASHVQFFDLHKKEFVDNAGRHERMRTLAQLEAIKESNGMVAAMNKDDVQDTGNKGKKFTVAYQPLLGPAINDDCRHSSSTYAQAYQYAVDIMGAPVAFGSDFNGVAGHTGPRFGNDACGGDIPLSVEVGSTTERSAQIRGENRLQYPFTLPGFGEFGKQVSGVKTFDFNVDGLAHVGLLPDLVKDMDNIGMSDTYMDALFNSAEEYIRVWERGEMVAALINGEPVPDQPPPELTCPAVNFCTGDDSEPLTISCPDNLVAECAGDKINVAFPPVTIEKGSCGTAISQGCTQASGSGFALGSTQVTCSAIDDSQIAQSCNFQIQVEDTISPEIIAPADLVDIECTSPQGAAPDIGQATASDICDAPVISNSAPLFFPVRMTSTVTWTATDGSNNTGTDVQLISVVDTTPPQIKCPDDIVTECTGNRGAEVMPGAAEGEDICSSSVSLTEHPTQFFDLGTTILNYTATDDQGLATSCSSNVTVEDTTPPVINSLTATPGSLWPPNHKMQKVVFNVETEDVCDVTAPVCKISSISSNQVENGQGDGNHFPDWEITGPLTAKLRKERSGLKRTDRVYTIEITCTDRQGLSTTGSTEVSVAHDQQGNGNGK